MRKQILIGALGLLSYGLQAQQKEWPVGGADERTPSKAEYFSWINNTNEGATEAHTRINLDFFRWMKERYAVGLQAHYARYAYEVLQSRK